jgi:hypothetical protein
VGRPVSDLSFTLQSCCATGWNQASSTALQPFAQASYKQDGFPWHAMAWWCMHAVLT